MMKTLVQLLFVVLTAASVTGGAAENEAAGVPASVTATESASTQALKVRASWGHRSPRATLFSIRLVARNPAVTIRDTAGFSLEGGEGFNEGFWRGQAGAGDVDGVEFTLIYPNLPAQAPRKEHSIWSYLLRASDADTTDRLRNEPASQTEPLLLTVQMNAEATQGFSVSLDQLARNRSLWIPELDVFLAAGEPFASFEQCQKELAPWRGKRVLEQIHQEPEGTYEQYASLWPDMGNPKHDHPSHIVGLTWDSAIPKFGVDRLAGVTSDLGNPDQLGFRFDFDTDSWLKQNLTGALPVINTVFERDRVRYEIEQFAYPLDGPPPERRGDIPMVLLQKVKALNLAKSELHTTLRMTHQREFPESSTNSFRLVSQGEGFFVEETGSEHIGLSIDSHHGKPTLNQGPSLPDAKSKRIRRTMTFDLPLDLSANASTEFVIKIPSPMVAPAERGKLLGINYSSARQSTLEFWSKWVERGAKFQVPDPAVNELFRANVWHALRLPRRHGSDQADLRIDLPYSNFAYGQDGTPWPVNQAVYVDYMLYDLRGYHDLALEELVAIYRNNQQPDGRVGGFANWGVYTPSMLYASAKHQLLSRDPVGSEKLLAPTLRALDWCLMELKRTPGGEGAAHGLILMPLNDLSHEKRAWAFNQAYMFAGLDTLGQWLRQIHHPRAKECSDAAQSLRQAIARDFANASVLSPLVQLRDHTWMPYVPCDALTPRRLFEEWYPTDVDTGALHLSRLKALEPAGALTWYLLNDHEDNLFLNGLGMANEPVYNQQAMTYLFRDDAEAGIRSFYSYMACAFSQSVFEPVEHRWGWGQYFGPPSTDGAWFELYRHMLIHELDDGTLLIGQATPRNWLRNGETIRVEHAPTLYGPLSLTVESRADAGVLSATVEWTGKDAPHTLLIRLRCPDHKPIRSAEVNGIESRDFDPAKEWVRVQAPKERRYHVVARY